MTLQICYKDIDAKDTEELIAKIHELIPSNKGEGRNISAVEFSTIHRAKRARSRSYLYTGAAEGSGYLG